MFAVTYLVHLVPRGVQVALDNLASKRLASNVDLHIRVTLAFHHAAHQVIFGNEILAGQEVNPEETLGGRGREESHMCILESQSYSIGKTGRR